MNDYILQLNTRMRRFIASAMIIMIASVACADDPSSNSDREIAALKLLRTQPRTLVVPIDSDPVGSRRIQLRTASHRRYRNQTTGTAAQMVDYTLGNRTIDFPTAAFAQDQQQQLQLNVANENIAVDSDAARPMVTKRVATEPIATEPIAAEPAAALRAPLIEATTNDQPRRVNGMETVSTPEPRSDFNPSIEAALQRRGSVTFRQTDIREAVFALSEVWNINIVAGGGVEGQVSGSFRNAPLVEVLNSLLLSTGYGYQRIGQSFVILKSDQVSTPGGEVAYFTLQYTEATTLSKPLSDALKDLAVVSTYPEENRIMVMGASDSIRLATDMISQLDRPRAQVRITAMIYDVSLGEINRLGINWGVQPHSNSLTLLDLNGEDVGFRNMANGTSALIPGSDLLADGATNLALRSTNSIFNLDTMIHALDNSSESKLLADPSIVVNDRTDAEIQIVQRVPVQATQLPDGGANVISQVTFEEAGVKLKVLPRIARDGTIELKVAPEFSVVSGYLANNPIIDARNADTTVRVADGQMFVLGGLRQKTITETVRGIPKLRDLKYIGRLFRSHGTEVRESELIVFLRPEIITSCYAGNPRETTAYQVSNDYLDRIPYAEDIPLTPCCCDPNCPNHSPRPRINPGSEGMIESW